MQLSSNVKLTRMNLKILTTLKAVNFSPPSTVYSKKLSMIALAVSSSAVFVLLCVGQTDRCRVASVGHLVRCSTVQPHHRTGFYRTRVRSLAMLVSDSLTDSLTHSCLVNLMALNDTNCLMMSQQLLTLLM